MVGGRVATAENSEEVAVPTARAGTAEPDDDYLVQWIDQDKLRAKLAFATNKPIRSTDLGDARGPVGL